MLIGCLRLIIKMDIGKWGLAKSLLKVIITKKALCSEFQRFISLECHYFLVWVKAWSYKYLILISTPLYQPFSLEHVYFLLIKSGIICNENAYRTMTQCTLYLFHIFCSYVKISLVMFEGESTSCVFKMCFSSEELCHGETLWISIKVKPTRT